MVVRSEPIDFYTAKLGHEPFALGMIGDGELIAARYERVGGHNAVEETYTQALCDDMAMVLNNPIPGYHYATDPNFATNPDGKWIDQNLNIPEWFDGVVFDRAAREGQLGGFIKRLRKLHVVVVGGPHLKQLCPLVGSQHFIETPAIDSHAKLDEIMGGFLLDTRVYLLMIGLAGPVVAYKGRQNHPYSTFIDIGSVMDVFVGAGANRGWRNEMYADPVKYSECLVKNLCA